MSKHKLREYLTYDDVLLMPAYSDVLPHEANLETKFTKNISLKIPLVSAAMDTVTEWEMAVHLAQEGGIGVLHKNMSIEEQAKQVKKVKRSESGMIDDPITLFDDADVGDALSIMREHKIGGIPVINKSNKLVGIITNRDLRFENNDKKPIKELMTTERIITVNKETSIQEAENILKEHRIEKLPVIDSKNNIVGLITYKDILKSKTKPNSCKDSKGKLRVAAAIGINKESLKRVEKLAEAKVDAFVLDSAHGHSKSVIETLEKIKKHFPKIDVVVGNIATQAAAKMLIENGADAIKVGIGPGSICTTRVVTGVGVPQLSAIMDVFEYTKHTNIPVIADGGIKYSGDIPKALVGGASSIMLGSMLAGLEESPGETVIYGGRKFKKYRGMGSIDAMKDGSGDRYFQDSESSTTKLVPEGIVGRVAYKGRLDETVFQLVGGIKASMGYCGSKDIETFRKNGEFVRVSFASLKENHPHSVMITKEAPNYSSQV